MTDNPSNPPIDWDESLFLDTLLCALEDLSVDAAPEAIETLSHFAAIVVEASRKLNLTTILDPAEMAVKHFADSLSVLQAGLPDKAEVADVGTGGGFPGIPLAIARSDIRVTLIDSTAKKVAFLNDAVNQLGLENVKAAVGRAEELGHHPKFRESFHIAVWRGLGELVASSELCLPLVKVGGIGIAMKGPKLDEELSSARAMIGQLGAKISRTIDVRLPKDIDHKLLVLEKTRPTPQTLPRPWAKIKRDKQ